MSQLISAIKKVIPFKKELVSIRDAVVGRERRVSYGHDDPDKTFYVIGMNDPGGGLFWLVNKVVMHIAYAVDRGYIPVVDFKNYVTQYTEKGEEGKVNVWDLFFLQPAGYNLDDIKHSKNVIICKKTPAPRKKYLMGQVEFYSQPERIAYFRGLFKKYIKPNEHTSEYLRDMKSRLLGSGERTVGVLCRGTDYVSLKPKGHFVQPVLDDVISDVRKAMRQYSCTKVFIATEDEDILETFKAEFGDDLRYVEQRRVRGSEMAKGLLLAEENRLDSHRNPKDDAIKYLSAIYLLAQCQCFISGRTGGAKGVLLMSDGFEYQKLYDLGFYK